MMFGRHRSKTDRFASTAIHAPGDLYTSRRHRDDDEDDEEVGADGGIDALLEQEIRRYEELFDPSTSPGEGSPGADDDTLMDGSIYTSSPTMASAPSKSIKPRQNHHVSHQQGLMYDAQEDESIWGLPNTSSPRVVQAATTTLLTSRESAAASACAIQNNKPSASTKLSNGLKILAVEKSESKYVPVQEKKQTTPAPDTKKKLKKSFSSRFFGATKSNVKTVTTQASSSKNQAGALPSTPVSRQQPTSTPKTQASTPAAPPASSNAPKMKFFSPSKLFQKTSHHKAKAAAKTKPVHPNLLLASFQRNASTAAAVERAPPRNTSIQQHPQVAAVRLPSTPVTRCRPPSPPPPMDHCEIISIGSAQSSLTEMDAWLHSATPPKKSSLIGSGEGQQSLGQGHGFVEAYDGGLSPRVGHDEASATDDDDNEGAVPRVHIEFDKEDLARESSLRDGTDDYHEVQDNEDQESAESKRKEGLYFHDNAGRPISPLRGEAPAGEDAEPVEDEAAAAVIKDLASFAWSGDAKGDESVVIHSQDEGSSKYNGNLLQVVKILALDQKQDGSSPTNKELKRNLFGTKEKDDDDQPPATKEGDEKTAENHSVPVQKPQIPILSPEIALFPKKAPHKPSKFKQFLKKLASKSSSTSASSVNKSKQQQRQHDTSLEQERITKATKVEENSKREKSENSSEIEEQHSVEQECHQNQSLSATSDTGLTSGSSGLGDCPTKPRSFSLLSGSMKADEMGSLPAVSELPSSHESDEKKVAPFENTCVLCKRVDHPRTHIVIPCMHYALCDVCVEESREVSAGCHCPTCNTEGFLFARVGVLEGPDLQAKLLQLGGSSAAAPSSPVVNQ